MTPPFDRRLSSSGSAKANRIASTTVPGSPQDNLEASPNKILFNGETRSNMPTIDEHENICPSEDEDEQDDAFTKKSKQQTAQGKQTETPALDTFGTDITKAAKEKIALIDENSPLYQIAQSLAHYGVK